MVAICLSKTYVPHFLKRNFIVFFYFDEKQNIVFLNGFLRMSAQQHRVLLYINRQSFPFHAFHWWRAYHVRLKKSNCLLRISARGGQCIIHR